MIAFWWRLLMIWLLSGYLSWATKSMISTAGPPGIPLSFIKFLRVRRISDLPLISWSKSIFFHSLWDCNVSLISQAGITQSWKSSLLLFLFLFLFPIKWHSLSIQRVFLKSRFLFRFSFLTFPILEFEDGNWPRSTIHILNEWIWTTEESENERQQERNYSAKMIQIAWTQKTKQNRKTKQKNRKQKKKQKQSGSNK